MKELKQKISTGSLPASKKVYVTGEKYNFIKVPMREIELHPSANEKPLTVYDSSGSYTYENIDLNIHQGL